MFIEYMKIKSFGNVENMNIDPANLSDYVGNNDFGFATYMAFQLYIFYGVKTSEYDISSYLDSAKGMVAGGYIVISDEDRRYIVAREYLRGQERLMIKDADTDVEIEIDQSAGEYFFSRNVTEFIHGTSGAPVNITDILKTAQIPIENTGKINANEILELRERLDDLGRKQMILSVESMSSRGVNSSKRLERAREIQKELMETDEKLKNAGTGGSLDTLVSKKTMRWMTVLCILLFILGIIISLAAESISVVSVVSMIICFGLSVTGFLWMFFFRVSSKFVSRNMPNTEETLRQRRGELIEQLDILLEGTDFESLEKAVKYGDSYEESRSNAEIEEEMEQVRQEIEVVRRLLNEKLMENK